MKRKLILILALFILSVMFVSIVSASNETSDSLVSEECADDSILQDYNSLAAGDDNPRNSGLIVKAVWVDNDDEAGKRPSSIKFDILENGEVIEGGCEITESMGWQATLDFATYADSKYDVVAEGVPEGYTAKVTGNVDDGFVITYTLKEEPKNNTAPDDGNPKNKTSDNNPITEKNVINKTTNKTVSAKEVPKKAKDNHKTGHPILLGILAVSTVGLAFQLRRKE